MVPSPPLIYVVNGLFLCTLIVGSHLREKKYFRAKPAIIIDSRIHVSHVPLINVGGQNHIAEIDKIQCGYISTVKQHVDVEKFS